MKRVYLPTLTIDVTDELADLVLHVSEVLHDRTWTRSEYIGGGATRSQPFAKGFVASVTLAGYINGADEPGTVDLLIGAGIPVAVAAVTPEKPEAPGTFESIDELSEFAAGRD